MNCMLEHKSHLIKIIILGLNLDLKKKYFGRTLVLKKISNRIIFMGSETFPLQKHAVLVQA